MGKTKNSFGRLFMLSARERRGILWLLPLLAVVGVIFALADRPSFERSFLEPPESPAPAHSADLGDNPGVASHELFEFDPNTVTLQELCRLGFSQKAAAGIIKYRTKGKRFEIPEEFASCYGVSLEHYTLLEPYIVIGSEFSVSASRDRRAGATSGVGGDADPAGKPLPSGPFDPNELTARDFCALGFSEKQAGVIVKYRASIGGFRSPEDFARCYVVSEEDFARLGPYVEIAAEAPAAATPAVRKPVEINTADSTALRSVGGIGEVLVGRITEYRDRLGGFHRAEQLAEIQGMSEANYERIIGQITVDPLVIQKIDINFASHKKVVDRLGNHPYATAKMLRKLLKERQLKGGWSSIDEMVEQNIMTRDEAARLAPYLIFRQE